MKITISKKLNGFIIFSLLVSIVAVIYLSTSRFTTDLAGLLRKDTVDVAAIIGGRVRAEMRQVADRARILSAVSLETFKDENSKNQFIDQNMSLEKDIFALGIFKKGLPPATFTSSWRLVNPQIQKTKNFSAADFESIDKTNPLPYDAISKGDVAFTIAKLPEGTTVLRVGLPFIQQGTSTFSDLLVVDLRDDLFTALFAESTSYISYLVDKSGIVIGSSDPTRVGPGANVAGLDIIDALSKSSGQSGQRDFEDASGERQIGAFQKVGFADLAVISQVPYAKAELAKAIIFRRTAYLAGIILFLTLALGFIFSQSLTKPIEALAAAAGLIEKGDFSVKILKANEKLNPRGDEIHQLSYTFDQMVIGLRERDKVKSALSTYHSKELVDKVLSGELQIGGERKEATVLFTDIRGFTTLSEKMEPALLFQILNQYLSSMVNVILEHGGHIDKFIGDGILAVWGVPDAKDGDTDRAIACCLAMRTALQRLNTKFSEQGVQEFHIGMGLNFGPVIAGNIGSNERMEYTIIGDTVNTATRIETLTKTVGTDLLVSDLVLKNATGKYIVQDLAGHEVKGRSQTVQVFKIDGFAEGEMVPEIKTA